jgi:hypothetical protein
LRGGRGGGGARERETQILITDRDAYGNDAVDGGGRRSVRLTGLSLRTCRYIQDKVRLGSCRSESSLSLSISPLL